jgi:hypothetical protein
MERLKIKITGISHARARGTTSGVPVTAIRRNLLVLNAVAVLHTFQQLMKKAACIRLSIQRYKCGNSKCHAPVFNDQSPPALGGFVPKKSFRLSSP